MQSTNGSIYLSGSMEFAPDGKLGGSWRAECAERLSSMGYYPIDITALDVGYTRKYNSKIDCTIRDVTIETDRLLAKANIRHHFIRADLNLIDHDSDAMIINYDHGVRRGAGTISECQHAFNNEIPIFLVNQYQDFNELPGWLYALTTKVFNSFDELYIYFAALPDGMLKRDRYGNYRAGNKYLCSMCGSTAEKSGSHFVSKISPTYCKPCVDIVMNARESNVDRYAFFMDELK